MRKLIDEIESAMGINMISGELPPQTRARVDAMIGTYGREQTLAAMRSLVEPYAAAEKSARPGEGNGGGIADQAHMAAYMPYLYLKLSIKYVESLPSAG